MCGMYLQLVFTSCAGHCQSVDCLLEPISPHSTHYKCTASLLSFRKLDLGRVMYIICNQKSWVSFPRYLLHYVFTELKARVQPSHYKLKAIHRNMSQTKSEDIYMTYLFTSCLSSASKVACFLNS